MTPSANPAAEATVPHNASSTSGSDYYYECVNDADAYACAPNCTGVEECLACQCAIIKEGGGPWGDVMDVLFCLLPIVFLIIVTVKPNPWPTTRSLPTSALLMFLVRTMYLGSDPLLCSGCVVLGLHEALTPLSIMAGAIFLFETMEATYCMPYMMREIKALTKGHAVAECMLIFSFAYMVEGASGFGTPVALGAPMLVSTGHPEFESIVVLLVFNTFATVWGAVGTPLWFGFGSLELSTEELLEISYQAAIALAVGAVIIIPYVLTVLVPWKVVRQNIGFVMGCLAVSVGPSLGISFVNYEFPSLMGGLIGCGLTSVLIKCQLGLRPIVTDQDAEDHLSGNSQRPPDDKQSARSNPLEFGTVAEVSLVREYQRAVSALSERDGPVAEGEEREGEIETPNNAAGAPHGVGNSIAKTTKKVSMADNSMAKTQSLYLSDSLTTSAASAGANKEGDTGRSSLDGEEAYEDPSEVASEYFEANHQAEGLRGDAVKSQSLQQLPSFHDTIDDHLGPRKSYSEGYVREVVGRTFPIWGAL